MRSSFLLVAVLCLASPAVSQAQTPTGLTGEFTAKERALWKAVKEKNLQAFRVALAPAYVGVYADGVHDRAGELEAVASTTLRSFEMEDVGVHQPNPNTAVMTYRLTQDGDIGGVEVSGTYWAASVWQRARGKWQTVLHMETRAQ
jgi:hypothetical protein